MQTQNDNFLEQCLVLVISLATAFVVWGVKEIGAPWEVITTAMLQFMTGIGVLGILLLFKFYVGLVIVSASYPLFLAYFWIVLTPFLEHWSGKYDPYLMDAPKDMLLYGSAWFQQGVLAAILIGGYGLLFYLALRRL